jgi:hypothetical protein
MFVRPQILSTPHLVVVSGESNLEACNYDYSSCSHSASCGPYGSGGYVDTTYGSTPILPIVIVGIAVIAK